MLLFIAEIITVYSEKFSWHINILFRNISEFVNSNVVVRAVTTEI